MIKKFFAMAVLAFAFNAHADDADDDPEVKGYVKLMDENREDQKAFQKKFEELKAERNRASAQLQRAKEVIAEGSELRWNEKTPSGARNDQKRAEKANNVEFSKGMLTQLQTKFDDLQRQADEKETAARSAGYRFDMASAKRKDVASTLRRIDAKLKGTEVQYSYAKFQQEMGNEQLALERMNRTYDNSMMAAYMKQKFNNVLNSNTLCQATSACQAGKRSEKAPQVDVGSVFNSVPRVREATLQDIPAPGRSH